MKISCPMCKSQFLVAKESIGKKVQCKKCATVFLVGRPKPANQAPDTVRVACPHCNAACRVAKENIGKHVRCKSCELIFQASLPTHNTEKRQEQQEKVIVVAAPPQHRSADNRTNGWKAVAALTLVFFIGYFAGREHLRWTLATAIERAFSGPTDEPNQRNNPIPFTLRQAIRSGDVEVGVTFARIDQALVKPAGGTPVKAGNKFLKLGLRITNLHERKELPIRSLVSPTGLSLTDDVENRIAIFRGDRRHVETWNSAPPPLKPEEITETVLLCEVPLPKTQYIQLTIDLSECSGEVLAVCRIPAAQIQGFLGTEAEIDARDGRILLIGLSADLGWSAFRCNCID
ncbi:MAG: hypothetical protein KDB27_01430 [Planctomycetales bacterium]|nr:hypothetical protein [Planctomycetales bacterium]